MTWAPIPEPFRPSGAKEALPLEPQWYACRTQARAEKQVDRLLASAEPTLVRVEELEAVRRLASGLAESDAVPEAVDWWEPGTLVEVIEGPFRGMDGLLMEVRGSTRLAVRLTDIRMAASVALSHGSVRRVA